jgi:hypothetical protein
MKRTTIERAGIAVTIAAIATIALAWRALPVGMPQLAASRAVSSIDASATSDTVTQVSMRNVNFYVTPNASLRIRHLRGAMRPLNGSAIVFDDKKSFVIHMDYAEIGLAGPDLSNLLNTVVFAYRGAPLRRLKVRMAGTQLVQTGVLHKVIDMPFEITSEPSVTTDGLIRLHPVKTRILGVDGDGLMRAFGLSLEKILDLRKAKGVSVRANDLFLDPKALLPPPAIEGRLASIRIEGNELVQVFGTPTAATTLERPDTVAPAYMYYRGGTLRFGKLLMTDAEMQIVGLDKKEFFGFDLDRYKQQLVAGYSRTLPSFGLEVYMASAETLRGRSAAAAPDEKTLEARRVSLSKAASYDQTRER